MRFDLSYVTDNLGISRDYNLTVHQEIGDGLGRDSVIHFTFIGVQRLR